MSQMGICPHVHHGWDQRWLQQIMVRPVVQKMSHSPNSYCTYCVNLTVNGISELTTDGIIHCCTKPKAIFVPTITSSTRRNKKLQMISEMRASSQVLNRLLTASLSAAFSESSARSRGSAPTRSNRDRAGRDCLDTGPRKAYCWNLLLQ